MKKKKINTKLKERKDFGIGPIHLAAFLLDPKVQGSILDSQGDGMTWEIHLGTRLPVKVVPP